MSNGIRLVDNTELVLRALDEQIDSGLEAIGIQAESHAKLEIENAPRRVDTGLLRNSITYAVHGKEAAISEYKADKGDGRGSYSGTVPDIPKAVYIGTNVEYAPYIHDGTQKITPNRFIKNAVANNVNEYREIMEKALKGEL